MSEEQKKPLQWGETPWDNMSREELVRECQRMYAALVGLNSVVWINRAYSLVASGWYDTDQTPPDGYWSKRGVGGNELEKARQVLGPLHETYGESEIYRAFFRYAKDLLFEENGFEMMSSHWVICPECGAAYGTKAYDLIGTPCTEQPFGKKQCTGVLRKLTWEDMRPTP